MSCNAEEELINQNKLSKPDVQFSVKMATENCNIRQYCTTNMSSADGASSVVGLIHELCRTIAHYNMFIGAAVYL